jgi:hypothetical protein
MTLESKALIHNPPTDFPETQARLVRNRESAQLSRQRKKQYLDDLERRCRGMQTANSDLHNLVARLSAVTLNLNP